MNGMAFEMMSRNTIRQVAEIEKESFANPWSQAAFEAELGNSAARYVVALEAGEVIGYAGYWHILDEAHVTNVAVRKDKRGLGYGRSIMERLLELAVAEGIVHMTLEVRVSNAIARALYLSMGFRELGLRRGYYEDNGEDAVIMWLKLRKEDAR